MEISTRFLVNSDHQALAELYRAIASGPSSFVRSEDEISADYIEKSVRRGETGGVAIGAFDKSGRLIGSIVAKKLGLKVFAHVLSGLTIGVHPEQQGKGVGRRLFLDFIEHVRLNRHDVLRVELIARDSNQRQISFYESLGFRREGLFDNRIRRPDGTFEADVPMAWLKED